MPDAPQPPELPRRHGKEYDDNHYHDEDDVSPVPADESQPVAPRSAARPKRKLPPPKRRFEED